MSNDLPPSESPLQWYYAKQENQHGPIHESELKRLAQTGGVTPEDLVWNESLGDQWVAASSIEGLFDTPSPWSERTPLPQGHAQGHGTTHNRDLMRKARESLKGRWGVAVGATLLYLAVFVVFALVQSGPQGFAAFQAAAGAHSAQQLLAHAPHGKTDVPNGVQITGYVFQIMQLLVSGPLMVGFFAFFLKLARHTEVQATMIFEGFRIFWKAIVTYFSMGFFVLLWALLLVIPGIIAAYSYSMIFFILADDPTVNPLEALRRSKEMMRGKKWKLACLQGRFIGWFLLALLTCGLSSLWVTPYYQAALAHFYDDVRPKE